MTPRIHKGPKCSARTTNRCNGSARAAQNGGRASEEILRPVVRSRSSAGRSGEALGPYSRSSSQAIMQALGNIGRNLQGETAGQRGARAGRRAAREARRPARRTGGDRACAGALQQRRAGKKDGLSQDAHHANKCGCSSAIRRAPAYYGREASRRQAQLSEPQRSGPCPGKRQDAARKLPLHVRGLAPTMSAPPFPGTSGRAASKSATGSSTPRSRGGTEQRPRSDTGMN